MIRRNSEREVNQFEHKFGADGFITVKNIANSDAELNDKGRVFSHITLLPGCGIGYHVHNGDTEIYYILNGKGEYNDNGSVTTVEAGDSTFTPSGTGHALKNTGLEPLDLIALIVYS